MRLHRIIHISLLKPFQTRDDNTDLDGNEQELCYDIDHTVDSRKVRAKSNIESVGRGTTKMVYRSQLVTYIVRWNPLWNSMQVTHESLKTPLYRHRDILFVQEHTSLTSAIVPTMNHQYSAHRIFGFLEAFSGQKSSKNGGDVTAKVRLMESVPEAPPETKAENRMSSRASGWEGTGGRGGRRSAKRMVQNADGAEKMRRRWTTS
ncbi:hypothetical protein BDZ91DRAFT_804080 [Kalaharituber pfeilii]|nr:hypothetical protein BDZ91DRAFT_804080 [Kalaharituber pfeilii]